MKDFEVRLIKSDTEVYDITELVTTVDFTDNINVSGVTTFSMLPEGVKPEEGNGIQIICGSLTICGYIFKLGFSAAKDVKLTVYDQLRYLKASDTYVFEGKTASQIVQALCAAFGLRTGLIEDTKHPLGTMTFDNKPMLDMIADCVTKTLVDKKQLYYLKDNGGKVEFRNIQNCVSDLVVDTAPDSPLFGYSYERDIDSDTYNQIKLVRDNKATGRREIFMTKDSNNIKKWGTLQYYEKLDDEVNEEQAKEKADSLLFLKNRVGQKLTGVDILGEKDVRSGYMYYVDMPELEIGKFLLCTSAKHQISASAHTVKADFKVV